jgi:LytS/YehU family sensor histidine kinase
VGLANIRERLRVLYGAAQEVRVQNLAPQGLEVQLTLPFEPASVAVPMESAEPKLAVGAP